MSRKTFLYGILWLLLSILGISQVYANDGEWASVKSPYVIGRIDEIGVGYDNSNVRHIFLSDSSEFGTLWMTADDGANWQKSHDVIGHSHSRIDIQTNNSDHGWTLVPSTINVDEDAGPYRTVNGGTNWSLADPNDYLHDFKKLYAMESDQSDDNFMTAYVGGYGNSANGYERVQKTTDGGEHWTAVGQEIGGNQQIGKVVDISICESSPNVIYCAFDDGETNSSSSGVYRSIDSGNQWELVQNLLYEHPIAIEADPLNADYFVISSYRVSFYYNYSIVKKMNVWGEETYLFSDNNGGYKRCNSIAFDPSGAIYLGINCVDVYNQSGPFLLRWQSPDVIDYLPSSGFIGDYHAVSIALDPTNSNRIFVGSNNMFYLSENAGASFSERTNSTNILGLGRVGVNLPQILTLNSTANNVFSFKSEDYASNWALRNFWPSNNVHALHPDGNNTGVWFGVISSLDENIFLYDLLKSTNNGDNWIGLGSLPQGISQINCLAVDQSANGDYMYFSSNALYISSDNGINWQYKEYNSTMNARDIAISQLDPYQLLIADETYGVFRSTDRGSSWGTVNQGLSNLAVKKITFCPQRANIALVGTSTGIYKSNNINGTTPIWTSSNYGAYPGPVDALTFHSSDNSIALASITDNDYCRIYVSADTGRSWNQMTTGLDGKMILDFAEDIDYPDTFYTATSDGVYKLKNPVKSGTLASTPTTQTWGPGLIIVNGDVTVPAGVTLRIDPGTTLLFEYGFDKSGSGNDTHKSELIVEGTLYAHGSPTNYIKFTSSNVTNGQPGQWYGIRGESGSTIQFNYCSISYADYGIKAFQPSYFSAEHCTISKNAYAGIYLEGTPSSTNIRYCNIDNNATYGIFSALGTFAANTDTIQNSAYGIYYSGLSSPTIENCLITYSVGQAQSYYGIYATKSTPMGSISPTILSDSIAGFKQGGIYLNGANGLGTIANTKIVSSGIYGINYSYSSALIYGGTAPQKNLISSCTYGLYLSSSSSPIVRRTKFVNNTSRGVMVNSGCAPNFGTLIDPGNNSFMRSGTGSYYHIYNCANVNPVSAIYDYWSPLGSQYVCNVTYSPYLTIDPLPRPIAPPDFANIPQDFETATVYPNPFNPTTTIYFSLSASQFVSIRIYNLMGQEVKTLSNEYRTAGEHTIIWDGKNQYGQQVGTGVYFCQIKGNDLQKTLKMTYLK